MASIFKPAGRKIYRIVFKGETGQRRKVAGFTDKGASRSLATKLESDAARLRAGEPLQYPEITARYFGRQDAKTIAWPTAQEEYLTDLTRRGSPSTGRHYRDVRNQLRRLARDCHWHDLSDISGETFSEFLDQLTSARSKNKYHQCLSAFLRWARRKDYLSTDPLQSVPRVKAGRGTRKRHRRAYTPEETARLLANTPEPRRTVYILALTTGFRRSELRRLQKQDASPELAQPRWHLRPTVSKNNLPWTIPMLPEAATAILPYWQALPQGDSPLFQTPQGKPKLKHLAVPKIATLYADLKRASIDRVDSRGRHADFHSFRYTFCKRLAEKLPIQTVKTLMRHLTLQMTADLYGELEIEDMANVWQLGPILPGQPPESTGQSEPAKDRQQRPIRVPERQPNGHERTAVGDNDQNFVSR